MKSPASSSPMIQCVPGWDPNEPSKLGCPSLDALMTDYEVAELTWENGQLSLHGLRPPRIENKAVTKEVWDKPCVGDTLECVVNQGTRVPSKHPEGDLVPWFQHHISAVAAASAATMDALVPCSYPKRATAAEKHPFGTCPTVPGPSGSFLVGSSTHVDSCSDPFPSPDPSCRVLMKERSEPPKRKRTRDEGGDRVSREVCSRNQSASGSASLESTRLTLDTRDMNTSLGSPENTSSAKPNSSYTKPITLDDHDSVCRGKSQMEGGGGGGEVEKKGRAGRSSISSKRSRAAAIHNQSERKRRDRINQRMNALQKLVPNSSKTDKASMLDEVIEYLKQLQAQVHMMSRINTPQMMMPMSMQQLQMSMMAHMGMGMGMGMGMMDMNGIIRSGTAGIPPMYHPAFPLLPAAPWDVSGDRLRTSGTMLPDPFSAFLACQTQSMNMDAYKKMVALYQQLHQPPCPNKEKDPRD